MHVVGQTVVVLLLLVLALLLALPRSGPGAREVNTCTLARNGRKELLGELLEVLLRWCRKVELEGLLLLPPRLSTLLRTGIGVRYSK